MSAIPSPVPDAQPLDGARAPADARPLSAWMLGFYDRHWWLMLGLMLLFYLAGFNGQWRPEPDSALYLSIGRNLAEGNGYTYHGITNSLAWPGLPWLWGGLFKLFGTEVLWPHHVAMLLMGLASLAVFYWLVYLHAGRAHAVLMTCMVGMSIDLFRYSFELRNDVPFLLGSLACLAGCEAWHRARSTGENRRPIRWYDIALGLSGLVLAVAMRPAMWVLLAALVLAEVFAIFRRSNRTVTILSLLVVLAGSVLFVRFDPRTDAVYERDLMLAVDDSLSEGVLWTNLDRLLNESMTEAAFGHQLGPGVDLVFSVVLIVIGIALFRVRVLWGFLFVGTLALMLLHLAIPRYLLPVMPLLAIGWWGCLQAMNRRWHTHFGNLVFLALLMLWVGPNFAKVGGLVWEQRQVPFFEKLEEGRFLQMAQMGQAIHDRVEPEAWVLANYKLGRIFTWYSQRRVGETSEMPPLQYNSAIERYIVLPMDDQMAGMLKRDGMQVGPLVARIDGNEDRPAFELHALQPVSADQP